MTGMGDRPTKDIAGVRHDMARKFFELGFHEDAIEEARRVIALDPRRGAAHFDLSVFLLVKGDAVAADSAYAESVSRFGPNLEAGDQLRSLIRQGARVQEATRMLKRYFGSDL